MTKQNILGVSLLGGALLFGGVVLAQKPAQNVNPNRHPNLAAASRQIGEWASGRSQLFEMRRQDPAKFRGNAAADTTAYIIPALAITDQDSIECVAIRNIPTDHGL